MKTVYLDNHATTPLDPRVFRAMRPYLTGKFGNAASLTHRYGREALKAVDSAREEIARLIGAEAREIVFTSGATESSNLAVKGAAAAYKEKGRHLITVSTEHKSVLDSMKRLSFEGYRVTYLPVGKDGLIDVKDLESAIEKDTILISVMAANNETGVLQPVEAIGRLAKERGILFHSDATQAVGKIPVDVKKMNAALLSFSAHKMYGPKGVGALYVRKSAPRVNLVPLIDGGGHETGLRSGTLNVPGIVGLAEACRLCRIEMGAESKRVARLRDHLKKRILKDVPGAYVHGSEKARLPNNLNVCLPGISAKRLMDSLPDIALSAGSACTSTSIEPSYVLKAMGVSEPDRASSIRFGLGRFNTQAEIDRAIYAIIAAFRED